MSAERFGSSYSSHLASENGAVISTRLLLESAYQALAINPYDSVKIILLENVMKYIAANGIDGFVGVVRKGGQIKYNPIVLNEKLNLLI